VAASRDERNYVKKAVNWALRSIGKRSQALNRTALRTALELEKSDSKAARWIGRDAARELQSDAVLRRLSKKRK
jgi:3-methyladenine DNA glycosylase AlkD